MRKREENSGEIIALGAPQFSQNSAHVRPHERQISPAQSRHGNNPRNGLQTSATDIGQRHKYGKGRDREKKRAQRVTEHETRPPAGRCEQGRMGKREVRNT